MTTWIQGDNGNRASVEYWGSEQAARDSFKTLTDCSHCSDCSYCSGCSHCSHCSYCSGCSDCSYCSHCSHCSGCSDCSYCSHCSGLTDNAPAQLPEVPTIPNIHKRLYEAVSKPDALDMRDWHTCETTHCRAGWVVHLAGAPGYALEKATSSVFAAQQIYRKSGYDISPCRFYDSNEDAMADMKRLAETNSGKD